MNNVSLNVGPSARAFSCYGLSYHWRRPIVQWIVVFTIIAQLSGCSKIAYHFADWIIVKQLDSYLDLTQEQKQFAEDRTHYHLARTEDDEFPLYINLFKDFKTGLTGGLNQETFDRINSHYHQRVEYTLQNLLPDIGQLLSTLSDTQIKHLEKKLLKDNDETYDYLDYPAEKRKKTREKLFLDSVVNWYGNLTKEQKQQIISWHESIPDIDHIWHDYAADQIHKLAAKLSSTHDPKVITDYLNNFWLNTESYFTPELAARYQQQLNDVKQIILKIDGIITQKQRQKAIDKFDGYIELLQELAEKPS